MSTPPKRSPPSVASAWVIGCSALTVLGLLGAAGIATVFFVATHGMGRCQRGIDEGCKEACFGAAHDIPSCIAHGDHQAALWTKESRKEAVRAYSKACKDDDDEDSLEGCRKLVSVDPDRLLIENHIDPIDERCERDAEACGILALRETSGEVMASNDAAASAHAQKACDDGRGSGCAALARIALRSGNEARAQALAEKSCKTNDPTGCFLAGALAYKSNFTIAEREWQKRCDHGEGAACADLAHMAAHGIGVAKDPKRAEDLARKGCDAGNARSCGMLSDPQSNRRACDGGWSAGCVAIAKASGAESDWYSAFLSGQSGCGMYDGADCAALASAGRDFPEHDRLLDAEEGCRHWSADACEVFEDLAKTRTVAPPKLLEMRENGCNLLSPSMCAKIGNTKRACALGTCN